MNVPTLDKKIFLQVHPNDNVLVALQDLKAGIPIQFSGHQFDLKHDILAKHKFAITPLSIGDAVTMYGVLVGKAVEPIEQGGLVSTKNLKHASQKFGARQIEYKWKAPNISKWEKTPFYGLSPCRWTSGSPQLLARHSFGFL